MLRIAICDDDLMCLNSAKSSVDRWAAEKNKDIQVITFDNGDSIIDYHREEPVDVIIMDIIMPLLNGMEAAREIRKQDSVVKFIFLTSAPEFAVESYDVKATGYLLKPVKHEKLCVALDDCVQSLRKEPENIVVKTVMGYQKVYIDNIECIEAQNRRVVFSLNDGSAIQALGTFCNYAQMLTFQKGFFKCHRSYMVYIPNVDKFNSLEIITKSGARVPIARGYAKPFKEAYFAHIFKKEGNEID